MKFLSLLATVFIACNVAWTQNQKTNLDIPPDNSPDTRSADIESGLPKEYGCLLKTAAIRINDSPDANDFDPKIAENIEKPQCKTDNDRAELPFLKTRKRNQFKEFKYRPVRAKPPDKQYNGSTKFHWKPAIAESLLFLGIRHGYRMFQKRTRQEFKGPFFRDWVTSVKNTGGWRDGDSFATNYIAHPASGAVTGRIFVNNSERAKRLQFGKSKEYWKSRVKAMAWTTVWSAQFELGPISEASIGNVGLYDGTRPNRMGWVDLIITPTAGTGVLIGEDAIDKYVLRKWLERKSSKTRMKIYRTFFTPFQSFSNILRLKKPWSRDNR